MIKEESTSELLRFTIRHILNQVHNQSEYLVLKQQEQHQKQIQNNQQQQLANQYSLQHTNVVGSLRQVPSVSRRNNLIGQKMTPWKLSLLLSTQRNNHTSWW